MKKTQYLFLLLLFCLIIQSKAHADTPEQILKRLFPRLEAEEVNRISENSSIYEVVANGNIFYIDTASGSLFIGTMLSYNGEDLTDKKYKALVAKRKVYLDSSKKHAVQLKKGSSIPVYIVMDPECPYCKKIMDALRNEKVSVYAFFYPLSKESTKKISYLIERVLNGADYYNINFSEMPVGYETSLVATEIINTHRQIISKLMINGVPTTYIGEERVDGGMVDLVLRKIKEHENKEKTNNK